VGHMWNAAEVRFSRDIPMIERTIANLLQLESVVIVSTTFYSARFVNRGQKYQKESFDKLVG